MNNHDIDKSYVSPIDTFLATFDATHEKSASQQAEIKKHLRIAALRDEAMITPDEKGVWTGF